RPAGPAAAPRAPRGNPRPRGTSRGEFAYTSRLVQEHLMKQDDDSITDLLSRIGQRSRGGRGTAAPRGPNPLHVLLGLAAAVIVAAVYTSFFIVQPEEQGVV